MGHVTVTHGQNENDWLDLNARHFSQARLGCAFSVAGGTLCEVPVPTDLLQVVAGGSGTCLAFVF